SPEWRSRRWRG
ncbi:hypothetical protein EE612_045077, partial [Oryza sativa]